MKHKPRYSGKKSIKFWKKINKSGMDDEDQAYLLGCILQDFEHDILNRLKQL